MMHVGRAPYTLVLPIVPLEDGPDTNCVLAHVSTVVKRFLYISASLGPHQIVNSSFYYIQYYVTCSLLMTITSCVISHTICR